ncbi:membrane protein insertase YidC [Mangrovibacterium diazotrophicum]|uniref:Membrane protein insertase YidC n=1 Tax=Mangrovibacterium diazotrophicum TaxID=1261403 RepID=A0A419VWH1_9BACT|nr:membrane protein insertase YidC [Mangrovibacterium diazotrophicum]RKD86495.1 YidC/Oxa1 family membrane protein insertase [Mangrovibacterium diazotrophicum]
MDKNTIVGIVLIVAILIGFSILNKPSQEEIEAAKHKQDSIAQVEAEQQQQAQIRAKEMAEQQQAQLAADSTLASTQAADRFGAFAAGAMGQEQFITLENNLMKVTLSTKGGKIYSVELKNYQTYEGNPLVLFNGPSNQFGLNFFSQNRSIQTDELYFTPSTPQTDLVATGPEVKKGKEGDVEYNEEFPGTTQSVSMSLDAGQGRSLKFVYTLAHNSYMVGFDIKTNGLGNMIAQNVNYLNFNWAYAGPRLEKKSKFGEDRYTSVNYKYFESDVDKLSPEKTTEESLKTKVKWISFKQLFFNSTIIADDAFPTADISYTYDENSVSKVGDFSADIAIPYDPGMDANFGMEFYFGPNHYTTLKQYDLDLDQLVNLGYSVLRWVNRWLVIPVFNFLRLHIDNFGIIILLLTIFIKMILFPFTYKSYISQAKMRALKPEVDELNEKFGKDKPMEKQQATMALYKKAGVNPMGGCLPMLLQMPILFAMFFFFPTSIELRGESFLWATDLSSYDSIFNLPFSIPFYGDHVSLFCLLMTITTIISTKLNSQATSNNAMPGMQTMMYIMPVMFLFILNNYPAGLSYYYFLANLITIGQMYLFRVLIDDEKIRAQLHANKKKTVKKSKFQQRLEQMAKERGVQMPK